MKDKQAILILVKVEAPKGASKDPIRTKSATDAYRRGWDNIFGKKETAHTIN